MNQADQAALCNSMKDAEYQSRCLYSMMPHVDPPANEVTLQTFLGFIVFIIVFIIVSGTLAWVIKKYFKWLWRK